MYFSKYFTLFLFFIGFIFCAKAQSPCTEADAISQKGRELREKGFIKEALRYHQQAYELRRLACGENSVEASNSLINIGHCFYEMNNQWDSAIWYYKKAIDIQIKLKDLPQEQGFWIGDTYRCLSDAYLQKSNLEQAYTNAQSALKWLATERGQKYAVALNTMGRCLRTKQDFEGAKSMFQQAIDLSLSDIPTLWASYIHLSTCFGEEKLDPCLFYLHKVEALKYTPPPTELSKLYNRLGEAYARQKTNQSDRAISYYKKALETLPLGRDTPLQILYRVNLAKVYRQEHDYSIALKLIDIALKDNHQNQLADSVQYPYEIIMALTERANILFDKTYHDSKNADWQTVLAAYKNAIAFAEKYDALVLKNSSESALILRGYFYDRYGGAAETCTQLSRYDPAYLEQAFEYAEQGKAFLFKNKLKSKDATIRSLQKALKDDKHWILEYSFGRKNLLLFAISNKSFKQYTISTDSLAESVKTLYRAISLNPNKNSNPYFAEAAFFLYQRLIETVKMPPQAHVTIIPDGILHYLPFEMLLTSKPSVLHLFQSYAYLLLKHTIRYMPSAFLTLPEKSPASFNKVLAVAPALANHPTGLSELKYNCQEVDTISQMWASHVLKGSSATTESFTAIASAYTILHLSTHGIADDIYPDSSYLTFAVSSDVKDRAILRAVEIEKLDLHAQLVVLSACKTATGTFYGGEGLISLSRAFMLAGARSVVATLWNVDEKWTMDLTTLFYDNLKKGLPKDVALQTAKKTLLQREPSAAHPYFWSAFVLTGETGKIEQPFGWHWGWWGVGVVLLVICGFKFYQKFRI